jgi:uncharacterized protein (DUF2267 family)
MEHGRMAEVVLVDRICALTGIAERESARRVGTVVTAVLLEQLPGPDRARLARELPQGWVPSLARDHAPVQVQDALADFYARVAAREGIELGFAREHAQSCCRALAEMLDEDTLQRISRAVSDDVAKLFERRELPAAQGAVTSAPRKPSGGASVRHAQQESVARSRNPHADTKLSSSRGTTQEREGQTLARSRRRP